MAMSVNIPVLPALSHFTFLIHVCLRIFPVTAGNRTLAPFDWQPWGFSWQSPASVTGANPVTGLFKCVFGVTEISTTWTPFPPATIFQLCPCVSQFQEEECTLWPCPLGLGGKCLLSFGIWKALKEWIWKIKKKMHIYGCYCHADCLTTLDCNHFWCNYQHINISPHCLLCHPVWPPTEVSCHHRLGLAKAINLRLDPKVLDCNITSSGPRLAGIS